VKLAVLALVGACSTSALPETRYYQLAAPARESTRVATLSPPQVGPAIAVQALDADRPYDDERIVYRSDPYRLDYYYYHRWSSPPGTMVASYLADALDHSGRFRAVTREPDDATAIVVSGRVLAIEEVDASRTRWLGRVALELTATDHESGRVLWTRRFDDSEPMPSQSPAGLARALTIAMKRISQRVLVNLVDLTESHTP
jgi:ABC-type uncharacterized transport system auxiliary subunit